MLCKLNRERPKSELIAKMLRLLHWNDLQLELGYCVPTAKKSQYNEKYKQ